MSDRQQSAHARERRHLLSTIGGSLAVAGCLGAPGGNSGGNETADDGAAEDGDDDGAADDRADDTGARDEEIPAQIELGTTTLAAPSYGRKDTVEATVAVQNHGDVGDDIWIGFAVIDIWGTAWDGDETTHRQVTVPGRETVTTSVEWPVEPDAPTGRYDAVVALWEHRLDRDSDQLTGEIDRRRQQSAFTITEARPAATTADCPIRGDALYVWRETAEAVTGETAAFLDRIECIGVDTIYLSWGGLPDRIQEQPAELGEFRDQCDDRGLRLQLLWGESWGMQAVDEVRTDVDAMVSHPVDAIHLDVEPHPDEPDLSVFLDVYSDLLDDLTDATVTLSVFMAPWWFSSEITLARRIRDHDAVSEVALAAYHNTESACRQQLRRALTGDPRHPYYATFEFQSPAVDVIDDEITFWETGAPHAMDVVGSIAADPPTPNRFRGIALHDFGAVTDSHYR